MGEAEAGAFRDAQLGAERWLPVLGYEGVYEVSDQGRVKRVGKAARHGKGRGGGARIGLVLAPQKQSGGYRAVQLWREGLMKRRLVHVLVALAFLGPPPERHEVNHIDGDKTRNGLTNLEYLTRSENNKHAYRIGLRRVSATTIEALVRARRKPRVMVGCACGCGTQIETPDRKGRARRFVIGHGRRLRSAT